MPSLIKIHHCLNTQQSGFYHAHKIIFLWPWPLTPNPYGSYSHHVQYLWLNVQSLIEIHLIIMFFQVTFTKFVILLQQYSATSNFGNVLRILHKIIYFHWEHNCIPLLYYHNIYNVRAAQYSFDIKTKKEEIWLSPTIKALHKQKCHQRCHSHQMRAWCELLL